MNNLVISAILFIFSIVFVTASHQYRYYYYRPASHSSLPKRITKLEKEVESLERPVHVHVHGNDEEYFNLEGTHVHLHLSLDGQGGMGLNPTMDEWSYATCQLQPNSARSPLDDVQGVVHLRQKRLTNLEIKVEITGFPKPALYGFHVHEAADFSNGCNSFEGHFNPFGKVHGGPSDTIRHVGDWGNIQANRQGNVSYTIEDGLASLYGPNTIVGRGIVVHEGQDDLGRGGDDGSKKTGNAGPRLACCVIGWAKQGPW